jgi:methylated-DNA-protein-cysteine methyltransferase-like protein
VPGRRLRAPLRTQRLCVILYRLSPITSAKERKMSLWDPVYKLVKQIPRGRVLSYGAVARLLRLKGGARSAGRAISATPQGKGIPWHRVLDAAGKIVIREPYSSLQRRLLESEGVEVIENRVRMKTYLWTPARHPKRSSAITKRSSKRTNKRTAK